jgi:hypothetical protein
MNGESSGAGPGVIQPPVTITFNMARHFTGGSRSDEVAYDQSQYFGSFDGSTNDPISYPIPQTGSNQMIVQMTLTMGQYPNWSPHSFQWTPTSTTGAVFAMQTSTNLTNWITLFTTVNNGSVYTYSVLDPSSTARFYRLIPQ